MSHLPWCGHKTSFQNITTKKIEYQLEIQKTNIKDSAVYGDYSFQELQFRMTVIQCDTCGDKYAK